jgi:3-isopropylmalate dehydrogenase
MLEISFGWQKESKAIIDAVDSVLKKGYRTSDIADQGTPAHQIVGTDKIGQKVIEELQLAVAIA